MKKVVHELLWLLVILLVSLPLALGLHRVAEGVDILKMSLLKLLPQPHYGLVLLYCLVVIGCYLVRLAAAGATVLVAKVPEDY